MATLVEVIVASDTDNIWNTCAIYNHQTGLILKKYITNPAGTAEARSLNFIGNDYIAVAEKKRPLLYIWPLNAQERENPGKPFVLPGKASSVAFSNDGLYLAAGIDNKIYIWQVSSGSMLCIITEHYKKITMLKFTPDGRYFISAAEDNMVMVWCLVTVIAHPDVDIVDPLVGPHHHSVYVFRDHSLPVTDLAVSKLGIQGRLATVSSDRSCKIYELATGQRLLNIIFGHPLLSVTFDVLELNVFVGTLNGNIYEIGFARYPRLTGNQCFQCFEVCKTFMGHIKGVTCLSVSLDAETLMSGSDDKKIILWHIPSREAFRIILHEGAITNAFFTMNKPSIFNYNFKPTIVFAGIDRELTKKNIDKEVQVLTVRSCKNFWPNEFSNDHECERVVKEVKVVNEEGSQKCIELQNEISKLRKINADLYAYCKKALKAD